MTSAENFARCQSQAASCRQATPGKARTADGRWIVFEVTKVGHADESEIKPEQRTQFLSVQAERLGDEDALATGRQERKRMRVDIAEDRL